MTVGPKLLVTGFGPFPNAPANPTATLVKALALEPATSFGASALRAVVLPTDYRTSWPKLRRCCARFAPDIVLHFGLSRLAQAIHIETTARRACAPDRPDAAGYAPPSGRARRNGPEQLASNLPVDNIITALRERGFAAGQSDDAGGYVCNATLYRSLQAAPPGRLVGFIHVPPDGAGGYTAERLREVAGLILRAATSAWGEGLETFRRSG